MDMATLWKRADELSADSSSQTGLAPIYGGGATSRPALALVFINPTIRNISSDPSWTGPRFPFLGTSRIWKFFGHCGLFDGVATGRYSKPPGSWTVDDAYHLEQTLIERRLYLTNLVKETAPDSNVPPSRTLKRYAGLLLDELAYVSPRLTVAFGLPTFRFLTGETLRLRDVYEEAQDNGTLPTRTTARGNAVVPCYFPIGRGNPTRAAILLKMASRMVSSLPDPKPVALEDGTPHIG